jgi:chromosome partitioning protein
VLVIGSHKGGTGKSTTAMHLITGLLYEGLRVASIDLDSPQQTLTRYLENRRAFKQSQAAELPMPQHQTLPFAEDRPEEVELTVERLAKDADVLVIDTPGGTSAAAGMALVWADSVITPINDSFLDLDMLAVLDPETHDFQRPGPYAKLIAEARARRSQWNLNPIDWLVIRNRLSALDARNKRLMSEALAGLAERLDFRQGSGLSERVIYRELFLQGLTLLDLSEETTGKSTKTAHAAARQELRNLLAQLVPHPKKRQRAARQHSSGRDGRGLAVHT